MPLLGVKRVFEQEGMSWTSPAQGNDSKQRWAGVSPSPTKTRTWLRPVDSARLCKEQGVCVGGHG